MSFIPFQTEKAIEDAALGLLLILAFTAVEEAVTELNFKPMAEVADILIGSLFD